MLSFPEFQKALIKGDVDYYTGYVRRHYHVRDDCYLYYTNDKGETESVYNIYDLYLDYRMFPHWYQIGSHRSKRYD